MKKLMHLIILSCQKASFLIEKSNNRSLSRLDKLQLKWHLSLCERCTAYKRQSIYIESILKKYQNDFSKIKNLSLAETSKEKIKIVLENEMKKN